MTNRALAIDGSYGEGGGTLLRTALVMSALTDQPVRVTNVRGGSKFPGIDVEDIVLAHYLAESTKASTEGFEPGSHEVVFTPTRRPQGLQGGLASPADAPGGRGANAVITANSLLPLLAKTGMYSSLQLQGETYGLHALSYDYFARVTVPCLKRFGLYAFPEQVEAGFGRDSRGKVDLDVEPSALQPINWPDRGSLRECKAILAYSEMSPHIVQRGASHLANLARGAQIDVEVETQPVDARDPGIYMTLYARYERGFGGATVMGVKGVRVESLVQGLFEDFFSWLRSGATVDAHLADQILIPATQAEGETHFTVPVLTKRFLTMVWVIKQFAPIPMTVKGKEGERGAVTIKR